MNINSIKYSQCEAIAKYAAKLKKKYLITKHI